MVRPPSHGSVGRARVVLAASVMGGAIVACQVLAGIADRPFVVDASAPPADAEYADTGSEAAAPIDPCGHFGPPPKPAIPFDETNIQYVLALRTADFTGGDGNGHPLGFDLDDVCTCDTRPGTAHGGVSACAPPPGADYCDYDGGVDNAVFKPFDAITRFTPNINGDLLGKQLTCGRQTLLIYIAGYNGKADDDQVSVGLVPSWGIREPQEAGVPDADCYATGSPEERAQPPYPPRWDGTDRWSTMTGTVARGSTDTIPTVLARGAYVAGFRLVVPLRQDYEVTFFLAGSAVTMAGPLVVADMVGIDEKGNDVDGGVLGGAARFRIADGVLGGRVSADDFLRGIGYLKRGSVLLCEDNTTVKALVISSACGARDIPSDPRRDFQSQPDGAPFGCDAISMALRFSAAPAQLADDYLPDASPDATCPSGWAVCP